MDYDELVAKVIALLQREKRVPYRALKPRFDIDDEYIEGLKDELIYAKKLALDEENRVLVLAGESAETSRIPRPWAGRVLDLSTVVHTEPILKRVQHDNGAGVLLSLYYASFHHGLEHGRAQCST